MLYLITQQVRQLAIWLRVPVHPLYCCRAFHSHDGLQTIQDHVTCTPGLPGRAQNEHPSNAELTGQLPCMRPAANAASMAEGDAHVHANLEGLKGEAGQIPACSLQQGTGDPDPCGANITDLN